MTERERIGNRIRELREQKGLSQSELAKSVGIRQQQIARIESGKHSTGIEILSDIVNALGYEIDLVEKDFS